MPSDGGGLERIPTRRRPPTCSMRLYSLAQAVTRLCGWVTDLAAILALSYIIRCWPHESGAVAAGLVGAAAAMLNDSWEMVAHVDPTNNLSPLAPARAVMNDIFSLAVCMGGLMLLVFSDLREERQAALIEGFQANDDWREKRRLMTTGQWLLAGVATWRFIFAIWSGCNCSRQRRERRERWRRDVRTMADGMERQRL